MSLKAALCGFKPHARKLSSSHSNNSAERHSQGGSHDLPFSAKCSRFWIMKASHLVWFYFRNIHWLLLVKQNLQVTLFLKDIWKKKWKFIKRASNTHINFVRQYVQQELVKVEHQDSTQICASISEMEKLATQLNQAVKPAPSSSSSRKRPPNVPTCLHTQPAGVVMPASVQQCKQTI